MCQVELLGAARRRVSKGLEGFKNHGEAFPSEPPPVLSFLGILHVYLERRSAQHTAGLEIGVQFALRLELCPPQ